jgi:DNA-binding MarR family transcriptional regulator
MIPRNVSLEPVFHDLVRFQIELWNAVDARLKREHDLPLSQFEFMTVMAKNPACRVFDIAEELVITVGGTSKTVDRIVAAGRCVRVANPDDKRSSILQLTTAGAKVLAAAAVSLEEELHARLAGVADIAAFGTTLRELREVRS